MLNYDSLVCRFFAFVARLAIKVSGWQVKPDIPNINKYVLIAYPHNSNWDFFLFLCVLFVWRLPARFLGKHTIFFWPIGIVLRWLGGIPIDRTSPHGYTDEVVNIIKQSEKICLVVAPEGTRKKGVAWKTGFYYIALEAKLPILLAKIDYTNKEARTIGLFTPTGDKDADISAIKKMYQDSDAR